MKRICHQVKELYPKTHITMSLEHVRDGVVIGHAKKERDLVVNMGLDVLLEQTLNPNPPPTFQWLAIGTVSTAAAPGDTALGNERMKVAGAYSKRPTPSGYGSIYGVFPITETNQMNEACISNSAVANAGSIYCRDTYTSRNVISGDEIRLNYDVQHTAA